MPCHKWVGAGSPEAVWRGGIFYILVEQVVEARAWVPVAKEYIRTGETSAALPTFYCINWIGAYITIAGLWSR